MSVMRYTQDHEWIRMEDEDNGLVGITDYAQDQLGEIVFIELPEPGQEVAQGAECAVIESVKAAGELKSPVSGTVVEVNEALADAPETVNKDAVGEGWVARIKLSDVRELDELMDEDAYQAYVEGLD